jgi:branched-chain amino acid transport system substrate-binding protein
MRRIWFRVAAVAAVGALGLACGPASQTVSQKGTFKIGIDLPTSGNEASEGIPTQNGIMFAVKQANDAGGIEGFKVEAVSFDDAVSGVHNPQKGAQNIEQMVQDQAILGMIGPFNSNVAQAQIPIANQAHLTMISPSNTFECLTQDLPNCNGLAKQLRPNGVNNYFRVPALDSLQGPALADYAIQVLKYTKMAVGSDSETFGKGIAESFVRGFSQKGGTVVDRQDFDIPSTNDFKPWLTRAQTDGAQGVFFGGTDATKACIVRAQMKGIFQTTAPLMGAGITTGQCLKDAADNAPGIVGSVPGVDVGRASTAQGMLQAFRKAYPNSSDYGDYTVLAYSATKVLLDAIGRGIKANGGKLPSRDQVRAEVSKTKDFPTPVGKISFDQNGDVVPQVVTIYQVQTASQDEAKLSPVCGQDGKTCFIFVKQLNYSSAQ